jgi:hypothetical protein
VRSQRLAGLRSMRPDSAEPGLIAVPS